MPLDKTQAFALISPIWKGAAYQQNSKFYDPDGLEIDVKTGKLLEEPELIDTGDELIATPANVRKLLQLVDTIPLTEIRVKAAVMFGKEPPKQNIVAWIKSQASRMDGPAKVLGNSGAIDLGAWGRGEAKYLFDEVRRTIRDTLHRDVTNREDAIEILIEAGLLHAPQGAAGGALEPWNNESAAESRVIQEVD